MFTVEHFGHAPACMELGDVVFAGPRCLSSLLQESDYGITSSAPHLGFSYGIKDDGFVDEVVGVFKLERLRKIAQLAYLHMPLPILDGSEYRSVRTTHSRFEHSLDAYVLAKLVEVNNPDGLSEHEWRLLQVAALIHDAMTVAGGDTVKAMWAGLDEDENLRQVFQFPEWQSFKARWGIGEKELIDTVNGRGICGRLLDWVDKLAYVSRDLVNLVALMPTDSKHAFDGQAEILALLQKSTTPVCGLWDAIRVKDGKAWVTDPKRLERFLRLRALLFRYVYEASTSRMQEYLSAGIVVRAMLERRFIQPEELFQIDDSKLEALIDERLGCEGFVEKALEEKSGVKITPFAEKGYVGALAAHPRSRDTIVVVEESAKRDRSGTRAFAVRHEDKIVSFAKAFPEQATRIQDVLSRRTPYHAFEFQGEIVDILLRKFGRYFLFVSR